MSRRQMKSSDLGGDDIRVGEVGGAGPSLGRRDMLKMMLEAVYVDVPNKAVVAVKPRVEFEPFFRLNYEEVVNQNNELATPIGLGATMHSGPSPRRSEARTNYYGPPSGGLLGWQ